MLLEAYAWYAMVMYQACDTFMERHLTTLDSTWPTPIKSSLRHVSYSEAYISQTMNLDCVIMSLGLMSFDLLVLGHLIWIQSVHKCI